MSAAVRAAIALGVLLMAAAVVLFVISIWTVGPNAGRVAGTGGVSLAVGFVLVFFGAMWLDFNGEHK